MAIYTGSNGYSPITASEARELSEINYDRKVSVSVSNIYAEIRRACTKGKREADITHLKPGDSEMAEDVMQQLKAQGFTVDRDRIYW